MGFGIWPGSGFPLCFSTEIEQHGLPHLTSCEGAPSWADFGVAGQRARSGGRFAGARRTSQLPTHHRRTGSHSRVLRRRPNEIIDQVNFIYPLGVSTSAPYAGATLTLNGVTSHFRVPAPAAGH